MAEKELGILVRAKGANQAAKDIGKVDKAIGNLGKNIKAGSSAMVSNLTKIGVVAGGALVAAVGAGAKSLADLSRVQQQTAAVLASTNYASGQTTESIRTLAQQSEDLTTVDDKVVQAGENMLLTFTNIGQDVFPSATKAMVDMAIAMNGGSVEGLDLSATAIQLGKALNDPIKGVTALRKVGVQLTAEQEKQIKAFVKAGKIEEAQKIILGELTTEFGNAGAAAGNDFGANIRRLQDAGEDLTMALATGLMPVIAKAATWLRTKLTDPAVMARIRSMGDELAKGGEKLLDWLASVDWDKVLSMAVGVKDMAASVVGMFLSMPDWVKQAVITGWGLNKLTGGALNDIVGALGSGLIKGVLGMNAGVVNINAAAVNGGGGAAAAAGSGISGLGKFLLVGEALALLGLVVETNNQIAENTRSTAKTVSDTNARWLAQSPDKAALQSGLAGTREGIRQLQSDPIAVALNLGGAGDALKSLQAMEADQQALLTNTYQQEQLLRENAAATRDVSEAIRFMPPPVVNVNVSTSVSVRSVIDSTSELYRSGSRTRVMAD